MPAFRRILPVALACLLIAALPARAAEGGFAATLSLDQKAAAGLAELAPAELAVLDRLVAEEVALARQQNISEFSEKFTARCSAEERTQAGLDRLTADQQARLNELVAAALAARPKPKERPRLKDSEVLAAAKPAEIHGSVTLSYGWSGGRSFHGGSLWLDYYDPASRVGIGIGIANYSGGGFYDYYYPDSAYGARYYDGATMAYAVSDRGGFRDDSGYGQGQSFRTGGGCYSPGLGGRRGH
jgi:hypothetical protein